MDTLKIMESMSAEGIATSAPEIMETKNGVHTLKSVISRISKSGNQTVELNFSHKYNEEMKIQDYLRFSSYPDFKRTLERLRHAVNNLSRTKSYLKQYFDNREFPVIEEVYTAVLNPGEEPQAKIFTLNNLEISQQTNHNKAETAKLRAEWKREIEASLDEGYSLTVLPDKLYKIEFETVEIPTEDGKTKKILIAKDVKYVAMRIIKERTEQFANKFAEVVKPLVNKEVNLTIQENKNGWQEIAKFTKVI